MAESNAIRGAGSRRAPVTPRPSTSRTRSRSTEKLLASDLSSVRWVEDLRGATLNLTCEGQVAIADVRGVVTARTLLELYDCARGKLAGVAIKAFVCLLDKCVLALDADGLVGPAVNSAPDGIAAIPAAVVCPPGNEHMLLEHVWTAARHGVIRTFFASHHDALNWARMRLPLLQALHRS